MSTFFPNPAAKRNALPVQSAVKEPLKEYVDVGGNSFRAIAAAIVSKCLAHRSRSNQELFSRLFLQLAEYYPEEAMEFKKGKELVTPIERLEKIIAGSMADFIQFFSATLGKMALTEIKREPVFYQDAYLQADAAQTSLEAIVLDSTEVDETVMAALAQATGLAINLRIVEANKELSLRLCYNKAALEATGEALDIQLQLPQRHYLPSVYQPARFEKLYKSQPRVTPFIPASNAELSQPLNQIKSANEALLESYKDYTTRLFYKLSDDNKMTKSRLIELYIEGLNQRGSSKQVGLETGSQLFFETLLNQAKKEGPMKALTLAGKPYDEEVLTELVHALARAMTIGLLNPDLVFNEELAPPAYEERKFRGLSA